MPQSLYDLLSARCLLESIAGEKLELQRPQRAYIGIDPTAASLHLGHLVGIMVLRWLQRFGCQPVIVLGVATAQIGDPAGKRWERPLLDRQDIAAHEQAICQQLQRLFQGAAPPLILSNGAWLQGMGLLDFLRDTGKQFRIAAMLGKESVRSRLRQQEGISFTEFSYPLLQSYDFLHLYDHHRVSLQVGGSDQWGNITAGIELIRKLRGVSVSGFTFPLLTGSDGRKLGKTAGQALWLAAEKCSVYAFYQALLQVADQQVIHLLKQLTFLDLEEIAALASAPAGGRQKRLAEEVTRLVHGSEGLALAERVTAALAPGRRAVLDGQLFSDLAGQLPALRLPRNEVVGQRVQTLLARCRLVGSNSAALRLIAHHGAYLNERPVGSSATCIGRSDLIAGRFLLLAAGKKQKVIVEVEESGKQ